MPLVLAAVDAALGAPKNEVMEPLLLGFLASLAGRAEAFRLRLMMSGRRIWRIREDSLIEGCGVVRLIGARGGWAVVGVLVEDRLGSRVSSRVVAFLPKLAAGAREATLTRDFPEDVLSGMGQTGWPHGRRRLC